MTESTVKLANGQRWTEQQFVDYYRSAPISGVPIPVGPSPVNVDRSWYMNEGPGRYYHPGMFPIIDQVTDNRKLAPGTYDLSDFVPNRNMKHPSLTASISHYWTDTHSADYPLRALVFGNESARISGQVVVNRDGSKTFKKIEIRPLDTNFDFEHNTWNLPLEVAREIGRRKYDPENQGVSYEIQYRAPGPNREAGRIYEPLSDSQLSAARQKEFAYPHSGPPGLLPSITEQPPVPFIEEYRQYLDRMNGDRSGAYPSYPAQPTPSSQIGGTPGTSDNKFVPRPSPMNNSSLPVPEPSAPTAPSITPGPQNSSSLADWNAGLAGFDPANPTQPAPSPLDNQLRDFCRRDPAWLLQLRR